MIVYVDDLQSKAWRSQEKNKEGMKISEILQKDMSECYNSLLFLHKDSVYNTFLLLKAISFLY